MFDPSHSGRRHPRLHRPRRAGRSLCGLAAAALILAGLGGPTSDGAPATVAAPPGDDRPSVPSAEAQRQAELKLRDLLQNESQPTADRAGLARKLLEAARRTVDNPAACYVLLRRARDAATQAGDAELIVEAVEELSQRFAIDAAKMRGESLAAAAQTVRTPAAAIEVEKICMEFTNRAFRAEEYATALDYCRAAHTAALKTRDAELIQEIVARGREIVARQKELQKFQDAEQALVKNAKDAEAHLVCGRYLCLFKDEWPPKGLVHLAKGSDPELKEMAKNDIHEILHPEDPLPVADGWWKLAEGKPDPERKCMLDRAAYWYLKALPHLSGLTKTKITLRLTEIRNYKAADAESPAMSTSGKPAAPRSKRGTAARGAGRALEAPVGQWVDLLPVIEPAKDGVAGKWLLQGQALTVQPGNSAARLIIPWAPDGDYDLQVKFTRTEGEGMIGVVLLVGARQCLAALNCAGGTNGLDMIENLRADANSSTFRGALNAGRPYLLEISVRLDGTQAGITVTLDSRPWIFYRGPVRALALHDDWRVAKRNMPALGLATQCSVLFQEIRLRKVTGEVKSLR